MLNYQFAYGERFSNDSSTKSEIKPTEILIGKLEVIFCGYLCYIDCK